MLNFGRPLIGLKGEDWYRVIDALRFAAHTDGDEAHQGWDDAAQKRAHELADEMVLQLETQHDCPDCEMIGGHMDSGHTEPAETCEGCQDLAKKETR